MYGRRLKVVTDLHWLSWLANFKEPCGRVLGSGAYAEVFDVTINNKSGRKHSDADCLSRAPVDPPAQDSDEGSTFFRVVTDSHQAAHNRADPDLRVLIEYL